MGFYYTIDKKKKVVMVTCSGAVTPHDVLAFRRHIVLDSAFDPAFSQLSDFTKVTEIDISLLEAKILAAMSPFSLDSRHAMIVRDNPQELELSDLFEATRRFHGQKAVRRFNSRQEALDWISSKTRRSTLSKGNVSHKHSVRKSAA